MRGSLLILLPALCLGSCSLFEGEGFEPERWNARLNGVVTYDDDLDIDGPAGSASTDFDEESYSLTVEAESVEGWAPYLGYQRGTWSFDWPTKVDFMGWSLGTRYYGGALGDEGGWFGGTRAFGDVGLRILDPETFTEGAEEHRYGTSWAVHLGGGLQSDINDAWFWEVGLQYGYGQADEVVRNVNTTASADNDWDWTHFQAVLGIGRRF